MAATATAVSFDRAQGPTTGVCTAQIPESTLRTTIASIAQLPSGVSSASQMHISDRILNSDLYRSLLRQGKTCGTDDEWTVRLERRRKNLKDFVGHRLICVLMRLPGVHYTIEIDPSCLSVVHWEWQPV